MGNGDEQDTEALFGLSGRTVRGIAAAVLCYFTRKPIVSAVRRMGFADDWPGAIVAGLILLGLWFACLLAIGRPHRRLER